MDSAATTQFLKESIQQHHIETEEQIERLKEVFALIGEKPSSKKCEAIIGLLKESESVLGETEEDTMVRDVAIIIAAQKIEHYEIASYGSLAALARTLGMEDAAIILEETLEEEKTTDISLTELAVESVNQEAKDEDNMNSDNDPAMSDEGQVNDSRQAEKHGDYYPGNSDSEYPEQVTESAHPEKDKQPDENEFLESEDDIIDYRGKNREDVDRGHATGTDYR
ncbi:ferritin-like domain-containing protein [Petrimonas sulfuriphila]|uniref:YciE/YciF ferroxidase family protein n=1 Tax=Petrimonas sulfuriphila TaxID=285070 RepID=UPI003EBE3679